MRKTNMRSNRMQTRTDDKINNNKTKRNAFINEREICDIVSRETSNKKPGELVTN